MRLVGGCMLVTLLAACAPTWQDIRSREPAQQGTLAGHYKTLAICFIRAGEEEDPWWRIGRLEYKLLENERLRQAYVSVLLIPGGIWVISPAQPVMEWTFTQIDPEKTRVAVRARNPIDGQEDWPLVERCANKTTKP